MSKSRSHNSTGLTLIEILIVVILMGTIAAVAVPRLSTSSDEAHVNTLDANLSVLLLPLNSMPPSIMAASQDSLRKLMARRQ